MMPLPFPFYNAKTLLTALTLEDLLELVAQALIAYSRGEGKAPVTVFHPSPNSGVHVKSAHLREHASSVVKVGTWFGKKLEPGQSPVGGFIAFFDAQTGDLATFLNANTSL